MESEQRHYELRSRSRSRSHTPMVPSRPPPEPEMTERHYDLRNWSRERSHTPGEVTSSRRSGSRSLSGNVKTHEKNMEIIEESKEGSVTGSLTDNQSTKSESSAVVTRKPERRSERQRAKKQMFVNGQSESMEDASDQKAERRRRSVTPRSFFTSDYSSEEGEKDDRSSRAGSAYEIYKLAGEWWNVFPKTDYTYSPTSQYRYEIAPGILAMPNMSRRPIHVNDNGSTVSQISRQNVSQASRGTTESGIADMDTVDFKEAASLRHSSEDNYRASKSTARTTLYKMTCVDQYTSHKELVYSDPGDSAFRTRYLSWANTPIGHAYTADSDTELDENFVKSSTKINKTWRIVRWFMYFTTFVVACFRKTVDFFKFRTDRERRYYGTQVHRLSNVSKWSKLWETLNRYTHNMYFFFVRALVLDTWLLSRFTGIRKWLQGKGPKILWVTLLPLLLLLGGWCITQYLSLLSGIKTVSETATERSLPNIRGEDYKSKINEEILASNEIIKEAYKNLINRIEKLENKQTHQMEHLINVTQTLEDRQQRDANFWREYDDKIIDMENKLDINELKNIAHSELKVIKYEVEKLSKLYSELKSCCDTNAESIANQDIEKTVEKILLSYFPPGISKEDLVKNMQNLFASRQKSFGDDTDSGSIRVSDEQIRKIVKKELQIYDADKTGLVDYALETGGGQIISTRCTQRYEINMRAYTLFGFPLYYERSDPRTVIQGNPKQPGVCWAFQDFPGYLIIKLRSAIYVTGFTLEHIPRRILPNGDISSAPRKFNVWGLLSEDDLEPVMFGEYEFTANSDESWQYFPVQNTEIKSPYEYVELRIHSNHGELNFTCLYRFRVHGRSA
ncbi:PREDICTED: SUN domain-containing protein 2-like isoform X2 [Vollenhovia emeryi]|uniref:SUN domain-containing protein 2-like isoform X2 n=1 Tax=Vollenhovia emeryi TaxID=411798 RepID=UPI0005F518F5|nr:PREDICTED: SUN domain-containing protein 2-like isoform X2 [Vollenhovia emeryi]